MAVLAITILMVATNNITPVKNPMPTTHAFVFQRLIAGFGVIICSALLLLAVPRFIAGLYALYPEAAYNQTQEKLPPEAYQKSINDLNLALSWYQNPEYWQLQGIMYLKFVMALPFPEPAKKQALLEQAQLSTMQGLKLSPVDPQSWFRLAVLDSLLNTPEQQIINALRLSFYAGRVEPELLISRLSFAYNYYNHFDKDLQLIWEKQVLVAWAIQTKQLVTFVALHPEAKQLVEKAFIYSPDDWKKLSNDLEIYLKKNSSPKKK